MIRIKDLPLFIIVAILIVIGDNNEILFLRCLGYSGSFATILFYLINTFTDNEKWDTYRLPFWIGWGALFIIALIVIPLSGW